MILKSTAFTDGGVIPKKFTCDGENINPPLAIENVPEGTQTLALIMEDPDVPKEIRPDGMWDHWLMWNIPPDTNKIDEGKTPEGVSGMTTRKVLTYGGPCPPDGEHRYFFKLFAIDTELSIPEGSSKQELLQAIDGHIRDRCELLGRYKRG